MTKRKVLFISDSDVTKLSQSELESFDWTGKRYDEVIVGDGIELTEREFFLIRLCQFEDVSEWMKFTHPRSR